MKRPVQQVTETMSILKQLRSRVLREPNKYSIVEITNGNGLEAISALHMLPIKQATVFSTKPPCKLLDRVKNLKYYNRNFNYDRDKQFVDPNTILLVSGFNSNCDSSQSAIDAFLDNAPNPGLIILPEHGFYIPEDTAVTKLMGKYAATCMRIRDLVGGKMIMDRNIIGPRNILIVA